MFIRFTEEYKRKEAAFAEAEGALCEYVSPAKCDCSKCPLKAMCEELEALYNEIVKEGNQ